MVSELLDPTDLDKRVQEYDWYVQYPTTDISNQALAEEKDMKMYVRAARLAAGEDDDVLIAPTLAEQTSAGMLGSESGNEEIAKANSLFYDNWLTTTPISV